LRPEGWHQLYRHRDEVDDAQGDDQPADDEAGPVADRAAIENFVGAGALARRRCAKYVAAWPSSASVSAGQGECSAGPLE